MNEPYCIIPTIWRRSPLLRSIALFVCFLQLSCGTTALVKTKPAQNTFKVAFYNVENLFDTEDHPEKLDDEFLPGGEKRWNEERLNHKLNRLTKVVGGMGNPLLLGVSEVENAAVLRAWTAKEAMKSYGFVHEDSPDKRGIDVALLFDKRHVKVLDHQAIEVPFNAEIVPEDPNYTSRLLLLVSAVLYEKDTVVVSVNHWPSRRGGVTLSEAKRTHVASYLVSALEDYPGHWNRIIIGDLNDGPDNKSVHAILQAQTHWKKPKSDGLYNLVGTVPVEERGTYKYKDQWNHLDHIIVSGDLLKKKNTLTVTGFDIYKPDWILYIDKKGNGRPNRTYGGPRYYGGYSDHLPVVATFQTRK